MSDEKKITIQPQIDTDTNIIHELLELKFKDLDNLDDNEVVKYLHSIYLDLIDIFEESDKCKEIEDDDLSLQTCDDGPTPIELKNQEKNSENINFIISKRKSELIDFTCPSCQNQNNLGLGLFSKNQFVNYTCPQCFSKFLLKIDFTSKILKYKEEN